MTIVIREAGPDDAATLARIGAELFVQTYTGSIPDDEMRAHVASDFSPDRQRAELTDPDTVSLLVEVDSSAAGFAQVRRNPLPLAAGPSANVELWRIYLDRRLHGRGVGRRLLERVGVVARDLGADGVWLAVWTRNEHALGFYAAHGFERVGRQDFHVGGDVHCDAVLRAPPDAF